MNLPKLKDLFESVLKKPSISREDVDPKELALGIEVELEHTDDPAIAEIIALHHLAEMKDYYTRLKKMEAGVKKEEFFST